MTDIVANDAVMALIQVVMINLVLSGDNAVVIGLAAAGLPAKQRTRAITIGILIATALRITFASVATQLLQVFGLNLGATQSHASSFKSSAEPIGNFIGRTRINFVKV